MPYIDPGLPIRGAKVHEPGSLLQASLYWGYAPELLGVSAYMNRVHRDRPKHKHWCIDSSAKMAN